MPDLIANLQDVFVNMTEGNLSLGIDYTLTTEKVCKYFFIAAFNPNYMKMPSFIQGFGLSPSVRW